MNNMNLLKNSNRFKWLEHNSANLTELADAFTKSYLKLCAATTEDNFWSLLSSACLSKTTPKNIVCIAKWWKRDEKHTTETTQIQNHLYCTDHFYKDSAKAAIKFWAVKGYLLIPESQLSLNKEGEAESSSWSASCLKRLPGWKRSGFSAFVDGGVCGRREKATIINDPVRDTNIHQLPAVSDALNKSQRLGSTVTTTQ